MKVLILGSGGREHALAWKLSRNSKIEKVIVMPGNPGMELTPKVETQNISWKDKENFLAAVEKTSPDYVVIGPEDPLAEGVADWLRDNDVPVVGPSAVAAQLESSKVFAKDFMARHEIPTAGYTVVDNLQDALSFLEKRNMDDGIVVKADALAGGKGVVVTHNLAKAKNTAYDFLENRNCKVNTEKIVFEDKLLGKELSAFALCDGENYVTLGYACDYKRVFDGDMGPNTGGMGGYLPQDWPSENVKKKIEDQVFKKVLEGMKKEGTPFKGFLFAGLMIEGDEINVIEFNVRMGDPETQILMPTLDQRFDECLYDAARGKLKDSGSIVPSDRSCVHLVLTSEGYPSIDGSPLNVNNAISYPAEYNDPTDGNIHLFFAGVQKGKENGLVNSGGRVLGVSAVAENVNAARALAYEQIKNFNFKGMHYRQDIANI